MTIGQNTTAAAKLKAYAERIERLLDEIDGLKSDLKDLKAEAKDDGFNIQALTRLVAIRRNKDRADREAVFLNDLILYAHATNTPLDLAFGLPEESLPTEPLNISPVTPADATD